MAGDPHRVGGSQWTRLHAAARAASRVGSLSQSGNPKTIFAATVFSAAVFAAYASASVATYAHPFDGIVEKLRPRATEQYRELNERKLMGTPSANDARGGEWIDSRVLEPGFLDKGAVPVSELRHSRHSAQLGRADLVPGGAGRGALPPTTMK